MVFSSASSVRSISGVTNYAYANSAMERICEKRRKDGLPAIAIQWGVVGDVGQVQRMKQEASVTTASGLTPQSVASCLAALDDILILKPIVASSVVLKEKGRTTGLEKNIVNVVANMIGLLSVVVIFAKLQNSCFFCRYKRFKNCKCQCYFGRIGTGLNDGGVDETEAGDGVRCGVDLHRTEETDVCQVNNKCGRMAVT